MALSWQIVVALLIAGTVGIGLVVMMISRPTLILYGMALVVSIATVSVYVGFTLYLSRLLLAILALALLVRLVTRKTLKLRFDLRFVFLFAGCIVAQLLSLIMAPDKGAGLREMFIYLSLMALFIAVLLLGFHSSVVLKAIAIYLSVGAAQGLLGLYQVVGGLLGLASYQSLLAALPAATPNMRIDLFYSTDIGVPRASGFHVDPNNYAAYLTGVILFAVALIARNRRAVFPYICLGLASMGVLLSLSRSGILTLGLGLLVVLFLLGWAGFSVRPLLRVTVVMALVAVTLGLMGGLLGNELQTRTGTLDVAQSALERLSRIFDPAEYTVYEEGHVTTRLAALHALASSPLLGIGIGNVWYDDQFDYFWSGSHSHHLDMLAQTGLLGASWQWAFMALVGLYLWRGLRLSRPSSQERAALVGLLAAFIAILLGNFMYHYYLTDFVWFLMGCGVALSRAVFRESRAAALPQMTPGAS